MSRVAIVGIFFDGYYDLWEDFLELMVKNWKDCRYEIYIVNNKKDIEFGRKYNVKVLHAGESAEYSKKVQKAVNEIDAEYLLLLLEDFWVSKNVNSKEIEKIIDFIEKENIKYYSMPMSEFQNVSKQIPYNANKNLYKIGCREEYTLCCQPCIWKREFLSQCIGTGNYNAWVFEGIYAKSKKAHERDFLEGCCVDNSNPLHLLHGVLQGKIVPSTARHLESENYKFKNSRRKLTRKEYRKHLRKVCIKKVVPVKIQYIIKKLIKTHSVIERYNNEIYKYVNEILGY